MLSIVLSRIPVWVFAIFVVLLWLGLRQSRTRLVAPAAVAALAMGMCGLSLYGVVATFGLRPAALLSWVLGIAASLALGAKVFGMRGLAGAAGAVRVPGSWWPLALMMGIFTVKFVLGFATGMGSAIVGYAGFVVAASALLGLLSGAFSARALAVQRFARELRAAAPTTAVASPQSGSAG